ncbi:MAG: hypothetical protein CMJ49_12025 [Planctomycetaceae bacterium]|nr:hypothetical protein [Planctomycetaceae bacterium]
MKLIGSLIVLLGLTSLVLWWGPEHGGDTALAGTMYIGFVMLGGWLTGRLFDKIRQPKISGYIVFGLLVGPSVFEIVPDAQVHATATQVPPLHIVSSLAIALIALTAGGEIDLSWFRGKVRAVSWIVLLHLLVLFGAVFGAVLLAKPIVPFMADQTWLTAAIIAGLCGVIMMASSPAVAVAMISDYRAEGPLSQTTLVVTVVKDLLLIVIFAGVLALSKGLVDPAEPVSSGFILAVAMQLLGSILVGGVCGAAMVWFARKVATQLGIFLIGCCMLFALLGEQHFSVGEQDVHLEPLLIALSAGLLMRNVWPRGTERLFHSMESMSLPVYCLFFALAGAQIDVKIFASMWYIAIGLVVVRGLATWAGLRLGMRGAGVREAWADRMWMGMIAQAGVSLVLVTLLVDAMPSDLAWPRPLRDTLVGAIVVNQLIGPIGFRHALFRTREASAAGRDADSAPQPVERISAGK